MEYHLQHLRRWLLDRPLLSIQALEKESEMPINTVDHFLKDRRKLPEKHYEKLVDVLFQYGYEKMDAE